MVNGPARLIPSFFTFNLYAFHTIALRDLYGFLDVID
jgi:hypothetical protein